MGRQFAVERLQFREHLLDAQVDLVVGQAHRTPAVGVLADGVARAKAVSNQTIENVRKAIGIAL